MATNKNQHFVPRCYLGAFSTPRNKLAICLYNIDSNRFVNCAAIKHQCSGDYFYGKDELLENAIQSVERPYGQAIREILRGDKQITQLHQVVLQTFFLMQHLRTEAAARRAMELAWEFKDIAAPKEMDFKFEIADAVKMAMMAFAKDIRVISDLKVCIFKNKTKIPFFTSDNPAIVTNRWHLNNPRRCGLSFGLKSSGLIALLPLSPELLFVSYDSDVYHINNNKGWSEIKCESDVVAFNQHQFINCNANIYTRKNDDHAVIEKYFNEAKALRPEKTHRINVAVNVGVEGAYTKYKVVDAESLKNADEALIHIQKTYPLPSFWPKQITLRNNGFVYTNGTGAGYVRRDYAISNIEDHFKREKA